MSEVPLYCEVKMHSLEKSHLVGCMYLCLLMEPHERGPLFKRGFRRTPSSASVCLGSAIWRARALFCFPPAKSQQIQGGLAHKKLLPPGNLQ